MTYLCLALLLVLAGIFYLVNRNTGVQASDDPLSAGIAVHQIKNPRQHQQQRQA